MRKAFFLGVFGALFVLLTLHGSQPSRAATERSEAPRELGVVAWERDFERASARAEATAWALGRREVEQHDILATFFVDEAMSGRLSPLGRDLDSNLFKHLGVDISAAYNNEIFFAVTDIQLAFN